MNMTVKKLNNFVTSLLSAELNNGEFAFNNPHDGWVHFALSRSLWRVTGSLDGSNAPMISDRNLPAGEAVCFLKAGRHILKMSGVNERAAAGVKLRVAAIRPVLADARMLGLLRGDVNGLDTWRQHAVQAITGAALKTAAADDPIAAIVAADFTRRGIRIVPPAELPPTALAPLAFREGGAWHRLEPTDSALAKIAGDPAHTEVEALAYLPDAGNREAFARIFALIRRYAFKMGDEALAAKK